MKPELVIFGCDGVPVDTEGPVNEVIAQNLSGCGLMLTARECRRLFVGGTIRGVQGVRDEATRRGAALSDGWIDEIYHRIFARLERGVDVPDFAGSVRFSPRGFPALETSIPPRDFPAPPQPLDSPFHQHMLDLGNRLCRVQTLRTGLYAVHDRVAAIEPERVFQIVQPLAGRLIA